jgi:hypothetical protein
VASVARRLVIGLWLAAAVVTWNTVFDAHVRAGARAYVDRQDAFAAGRGPRADMDQVMREAVADGLISATLWTLAVVAPGIAILVFRRTRKQG